MLFDWNSQKNIILKQERGVSFDDIVALIQQGVPYIVDDNPSSNHQDQKVITIIVDDYAYCIPCVKIDGGYFLKTIYPSRKATKKLNTLN